MGLPFDYEYCLKNKQVGSRIAGEQDPVGSTEMNRQVLMARPRRAGTPSSPQIASVSSSYLAVLFGSVQQTLQQ